MAKSNYIIRNYHPEDFQKLMELETRVQERGQIQCVYLLSDLIESAGPGNHLSEKTLLIAETAGEIVGYANVRPEFNIGRAVLWWVVHPEHPVNKIAAKLVDRAVHRASELGIGTVHVNIWQNSLTAKRLLTRMGFALARRYLELRLDLSEKPLPETVKRAAQCRPLQPGEEEKLTRLQNHSFKGAWGFNPNTVAEIRYRIGLPNSSPDDILLAFDSDKPIGYCWTKINSWENERPAESTGRIYMMGVDPDYRGRGLGRQLLLAGISYLKSKGLRVIELTVDRENEVARALYKSVGFTVRARSLWYETKLD